MTKDPRGEKEDGAIGVISDLGDLVRDGEDQPQEEKDNTGDAVPGVHPDQGDDAK